MPYVEMFPEDSYHDIYEVLAYAGKIYVKMATPDSFNQGKYLVSEDHLCFISSNGLNAAKEEALKHPAAIAHMTEYRLW